MTIRKTHIVQNNIYCIESSFNRYSRDMYIEVYINGEEISVTDIISQQFPYWKIKGYQEKIYKRNATFRDSLLEFKYINYVTGIEVNKIREMKEMYKHLEKLYRLEYYGN